MRAILTGLVTAILTFAWPSLALPQATSSVGVPTCTVDLAAKSSGRKGFARALLFSLAAGRDAISRADDFKLVPKDDSFAAMTTMMRATKQSTSDYDCATSYVARFQTDPDTYVSTMAKFAVQTYRDHISMNDELLAILKTLEASSPVNLADRMSTLEVRREQDWSSMKEVVSATLLLLADESRPDPQGHVSRSTLSTKEKNDLSELIHSKFPELKSISPKDYGYPQVYAEAYLTFLDRFTASDAL